MYTYNSPECVLYFSCHYSDTPGARKFSSFNIAFNSVLVAATEAGFIKVNSARLPLLYTFTYYL